MSRPPIHFSIVFSALSLSLSLTISHADSSYEYCPQNTTCGDTNISYPFGVIGKYGKYGCGVPQFQVYCVENHPLLSIGGNNYSILQPKQLGFPSHGPITIVKDVADEGDCNPSDYFTDLSNTTAFTISDQYAKNITFFSLCDSLANWSSISKLPCNSSWYYLLDPLEGLGELGCKIHGQVPINRSLISPFSSVLLSQLRRGFEVMLNFDENQSCKECHASGGRCGYNTLSGDEFICYCEDGPNSKKCSHDRSKIIPVIGSCVAGVAVIAVAVLILTFYLRRRKPPTNRRQLIGGVIKVIGMQPVNSRMSVSKVEKFLEDYAYEMPTRYSYTQLKRITNNFSHKLGEGGFGVVYKGALSNGTLVAAKLLDRSRHGEKQFMNEVGTIGRIHHVHLVRLLGFCFEGSRAALLYEYMPNGSLEKFIFPGYDDTSHTLNWVRLHSIALGAARGIAYLHMDCEKRIIHLDIKPHNILLDENLSPKVSDFGLAKLYSKTNDHISMTAARGTPGYAAPEMWSRNFGPVTDKSDVYSFGMLLLEMVGGRKNMDMGLGISNSQFYFPEWIFRHLHGGELCKLRGISCGSAEDEEIATRMSKVGLWCIQSKPSDRPSMNRVVQMLQGNGDAVDDSPAPFDLSCSAAPEAPLLFASTSGEYSPSNEIREIR